MNKVALNKICTPKQWKTISNNNLLAEGYPVYGANGIIGYYNSYNHEEPTILITCRGATCGQINICKEKSYVNGNAMCLDNLSNDILLRYLYYYLKSFNFSSVISGSAQPQITITGLKKVYIPLCSKQEQDNIIKIFDKIYSLIECRKRQLKILNLLVKSRFTEMFSSFFEKDKFFISDLGSVSGGLTKNSSRNNLNLKMPYLRVANVMFNKLNLDNVLAIGVKDNEIEKGLLVKDDLLFVEGNGSIEQIGRVAIWDGSISPCLHQNHLIKVRFNREKINPVYALYYFMSQEGRQQIIKKSVSTSGLNTLSIKKIENLLMPVVPIKEQNNFANFAQSTGKSKVEIQKSLDKLETLKKSLMQQYFG